MDNWNKQLRRHILKHIDEQEITPELMPFLNAISDSFDHYDRELRLLNRTMDLSSEELFSANTLLRKRNEELDRFVYSASHDMRAPLTSILGLLQVIDLTTMDDYKIEDINENLKYIRSSAVKLDDFIKDIILYTGNKKASLQEEEINFHHVITECQDKLSHYRDVKHVNQGIQVKGEAKFYSDPQRLDTIFSNILSNSIKYRDTNKNKSFIKIDIVVSEKGAILKIVDNGIGIEEKELRKVFNMFHRSTEQSDGSGIGLYIVKEVVEKLSGTIEVESVLGQGTAFTIHLPNTRTKK